MQESGKKRILCIGNMNNNGFAMVRYFRDKGYDAWLYCMKNEPEHFAPSADTYANDYLNYTKKILWSNYPSDYTNTNKADIEKLINGFDYIIGSGASPAYLNKVKRKMNMFIPYGSDLDYTPFMQKNDLKKPRKLLKRFLLAKNQKAGIENADYVLFEHTNDEVEKVFPKLNLTGERLRMPAPLLYYPEYDVANISNHCNDSQHYKRFKEIRDKHEYIAIHHSGQWWKTCPVPYYNKGTDKILSGFKKFIAESGANACIILFEYGPDVEASKQLVKELGIEANVMWMPKMQRKEIMAGLSMCDVGIAEVGYPWITYGVICEMLCMGLPTIMNRNEEQIAKTYADVFPTQQASTDVEVAAALKYYYQNRTEAKNAGTRSKEWFVKYFIDRPLNKMIELIDRA